MPELPEVETVRRGLERELVGRSVVSVAWRGARLRATPDGGLQPLAGRSFEAFGRHGKLLLCRLDDASTLCVHLGMTGKLLFARQGEGERPHTHLRLGLDDGRELRYVDPRRFGGLALHPAGAAVPELGRHGPDALSPAFTPAFLQQALGASRAPLKAFLLDQAKVAGVGNIYACEALWRARLSPRRVARTVGRGKAQELHQAIVGVLQEAIEGGGTSFNDYVDTFGQPGKHVQRLAVFQREGSACPRCGTHVRRFPQGGRSTFHCPRCQR